MFGNTFVLCFNGYTRTRVFSSFAFPTMCNTKNAGSGNSTRKTNRERNEWPLANADSCTMRYISGELFSNVPKIGDSLAALSAFRWWPYTSRWMYRNWLIQFSFSNVRDSVWYCSRVQHVSYINSALLIKKLARSFSRRLIMKTPLGFYLITKKRSDDASTAEKELLNWLKSGTLDARAKSETRAKYYEYFFRCGLQLLIRGEWKHQGSGMMRRSFCSN